MKALIARLGGHNLSKPWSYDSFLVRNGAKGFLSPFPIAAVPPLSRGAKTVECGIKWVKPVDPTCISKEVSGDLEDAPKVPSDLVVAELRKSQIWKNAPLPVQKLYTYDYLDRVRRKAMVEEILLDRVQRHDYDNDSDEVKLALMTATVRRLQAHMERAPYDKRNKVVLKQTIEKRRKRLKLLRRYNYALFEWILERLNLVYYPPPHDVTPPMRSFAMTEIATKFCDDLRTARLKKYREELEDRKPDFLARKAQTMRAINEDEKKVNLSPSFTEEEILEVERLHILKTEERAQIPKPVKDIF